MIDIIKEAAKEIMKSENPIEVMEGQVVSAPPELKIKIKNNNKMILSKQILVVPESLTDHIKVADINCSSVSTSQGSFSNFSALNAGITFKNALKVDDKVMLLSFGGGQRYFVIDRIV